MKKLFALLIAASLAANAALAFLLVRGAASDATTSASSRTNREAPAATAAPAPAGPCPVAEVLPDLAAKPTNDQLPGIVAELRAAGFPPEVVRAIVSALVSEQFAERMKALDPDGAKRPFWKDRAPDPKYQLAQAQLWAEQRKVLRDLLGPDADANDPMSQARARQQFGTLSPEKLAQAQDLLRSFDDKRSLVYTSGVYTAVEREKLADLDKQQRAALAQILTPAELEDYDLRSSNTGRALRTELSAFNPTEDEFRAIFKLRQPFDDQWSRFYDTGLPSQEDMTRRNAANKQLTDQIKAELGPVRGADYELATDYNYRRTSQLVARLDLPPETTKQLWDTQKDFQQRALEIRQSTPNSQERAAQLAALQQEAISKVSPMLGGDRGVQAYRQYGGNWIQSLAPPPRPAPKN